MLYIRNDGNIGIGTTTPEETLHIDGSILLNGFANANTGIYFREGYGSSTTNKYNNSIFTYNHYGGGNTNDGISINGYDGVSICTGSNNRQERMIINQSGNVGIGTTSPGVKLDVVGDIKVSDGDIDIKGHDGNSGMTSSQKLYLTTKIGELAGTSNANNSYYCRD